MSRAIADDAGGIPPKVLARTTEPFFTTRRSEGHNGLGLTYSSGGQALISGNINLVGGMRRINVNDGGNPNDLVISAIISNGAVPAGLTKNNTGTLQLTANNTYTGPTTVNITRPHRNPRLSWVRHPSRSFVLVAPPMTFGAGQAGGSCDRWCGGDC